MRSPISGVILPQIAFGLPTTIIILVPFLQAIPKEIEEAAAIDVQAFASQYSVDTAKVLAFTSLSRIPALIFFSAFERRIVGGLTGAVKG